MGWEGKGKEDPGVWGRVGKGEEKGRCGSGREGMVN